MKKKDMLIIFIFLGLISFSDGLFYSFQELWMVDNSFTLKTVSVIYSLCSLLTVSVIFLCSNIIKKERIKKFVLGSLLCKIICITCLYILHKTGLHFFIKLLIMIDYAIDIEIYTCIYPMMALINKDDKAYAKKDIIYTALYYFGVIITSFFLGKSFGIIHITYNSYLYFSLIFAIASFAVLCLFNINKYIEKEEKVKEDKLIIEKLYNDIKDDKISKLYFSSIIANQISYNCIFGIVILFLTTGLSLSPKVASSLFMILGIISVIVGTIVLTKLTFKNDYLNMGIKLIGRLIFYALAALTGLKIFLFIAIIYARITAVSYSHVTDAPYINRINKNYQLAFCNLKEMITYLGKSVGIYLCGFLMNINIRLNFLMASIFIVLESFLRFKALKIKQIEEGISK